jgi:putative ABC transport system ATP-binding protein
VRAVDGALIVLSNLEKAYGTGAGRTSVLRGVSLEVKKGEIVAIVGQSGSGKSTLLNIIGGLDQADKGSVSVLGKDYGKISDRELANLRNQRIGFVFQAFNLLDHLTCLKNVTLPATFGPPTDDAPERGRRALDRVGLSRLVDRTPGELSGGQKQRVAIARALFNKPELLLCDEPTGNLDSDTGRDVIQFFRELNQKDGVTLLIVTHEERVSEVATRIIRIEDGQILAEEKGANA